MGIDLPTASLSLLLLTLLLFTSCRPDPSQVHLEALLGQLSPMQAAIVLAERDSVIAQADRFFDAEPVTVTSFRSERSAGGPNDYYSEGTYWWPDSANPGGPYIRRDGLDNPDNFNHHRLSIERLAMIVGAQTSAYLLTGDRRYVDAALIHLKTWFVDPATRMNPHLLYAQAIFGVTTGRGIGIIDSAKLIDVARAVEIIDQSGLADEAALTAMRAWFASYVEWLTTHPYGIEEMNWPNNHSTWWLAQVAAFARVSGDQDRLEWGRRRLMEVILANQMATDGRFPLEIERTKPFAYSQFNLEGVVMAARALTLPIAGGSPSADAPSDGSQGGSQGDAIDPWNDTLADGRGILKGVEMLAPYIKDKSAWPYPKDVLYWEEQPYKHNYLLISALVYDRPDFLEIWNAIPEVTSEEGLRNHPSKTHLLWIDLPAPTHVGDDRVDAAIDANQDIPSLAAYANPILPGFNPDPSKTHLLWIDLPAPTHVGDERVDAAIDANQDIPSLAAYANPILPGFNPDPSIVKVGEEYYLTTSTFEFYPGLPIYRSRDLVNWDLIGHAIHRPDQLEYGDVRNSGGIFAPSLKYHDGRFHLATRLIGTPGRKGSFVVTAEDPAGPWSDPIWMDAAEGIDPSLYFDDDGRAYVLGNVRPADTLWNKHRLIWLREFDFETQTFIGERSTLLDAGDYYGKGTLDGGYPRGVNNFEGPHLYKRRGWYYLLIAHGGTEEYHAVSIFRSRDIRGPYESNPANPILTHRDLPFDHPITSVGHASLIEGPDGGWWMVHHGKRPYGELTDPEPTMSYPLGRETMLTPVDWSGDWPVVNPRGVIGRAGQVHLAPEGVVPRPRTGFRDDFDSPRLHPAWTFLRAPVTTWHSLSANPGALTLDVRPERLTEAVNPTFLAVRMEQITFHLAARMKLDPLKEGEEAGLVLFRDQDRFITFHLERGRDGLRALVAAKKSESNGVEVLASRLVRSGDVRLRISGDRNRYTFEVAEGTEEAEVPADRWMQVLDGLDGGFLGMDLGGGRFTGSMMGVYATSEGQPSTTRVLVDWVDVDFDL